MSKTLPLSDDRSALAFYEGRYAGGYMEYWPGQRKRRIHELVRGLGLPSSGEALDFGCGNGLLTEVLRDALPGWRVYGTDLSSVAVGNARKLYPGCVFFSAADPGFLGKRFDFLFSHHVLEHVYDLAKTLQEVEAWLKPCSAMLHVAPCGNPGSFEHSMTLLRKDGIDPQQEDRFYYEEPGHLRRLTTARLESLCSPLGFRLEKQFYHGHYYGSIDWITDLYGAEFVRHFTETDQAVSPAAARKLRHWRRKLLLIEFLRGWNTRVERRLFKRRRSWRTWLELVAGLPVYTVTKPVDFYWRHHAQVEWEQRNNDPAASEMYLFFTRGEATASQQLPSREGS